MICVFCNYSSAAGSLNCSYCGKPLRKIKTQKALGVSVLLRNYGSYSLGLKGLMQQASDIEVLPSHTFPCFARPAPSKPRHGYIDSRMVYSRPELQALMKEVLADDPDGEILLCQYIQSRYSAIWTPSSIVAGHGHDGATSGQNTAVMPLA